MSFVFALWEFYLSSVDLQCKFVYGVLVFLEPGFLLQWADLDFQSQGTSLRVGRRH